MKPKITDMTDSLKLKYAAFAAKMGEHGIPFILNCVLRTKVEQEALYAQGRESLEEVNKKRAIAGMYLFKTEKENSFTVSNTLNSKHFADPVTGKSNAFDIAIVRDGNKPTWDMKWDGNHDGISDYREAAFIGKLVGLVPGGLWEGDFKDWPHYQDK